MYTKKISSTDKEFHDTPPQFKALDRKRFFYVESHFKQLITQNVRGNANIVYIIVAYGYFKATGQFFNTAIQEDVDYVAGRLKLKQSFNWESYNTSTRNRHREMILDALGFKPFNQTTIQPLLPLIRTDARSQKNPDKCFISVCEWLFEHKVETPDYKTICDTVESVYKTHIDQQIAVVKNNLSNDGAQKLDALFAKGKNTYDEMETYRLTLLKKLNQSTKTSKIRENVARYDTLKPLYDIALPIVSELDFTKDGLKRYALSVHRRQVFQINRLKDHDRHLHLVIFIAHQFQHLVDILVETFLASVKTAVNKAENLAKEEYYKQRQEQSGHTQTLVKDTVDLVSLVEKLKETLNNPILSDSEKVEKAIRLISPSKMSTENVNSHIKDVQDDLDKISGQALEMLFLEEGATSLQLKCSDILRRLNFDCDVKSNKLLKAISQYQAKNGKVDDTFPVGFLTNSESGYVDTKDSFRAKLYRILLYKHTAAAIKDGTLSIVNSNRYRQLEQYLISREYFQKNRDHILNLADMADFKDVKKLVEHWELELDAQYKETNEHILENLNEYIETDGLGGFKLTYERNTRAEVLLEMESDVALFPDDQYIRIAEALSTVNAASGFLDEFEHNSIRYRKPRPEDKNFLAGIIALGEHLSVPKLSKLAREIELATLESTTNGFFTLENLRRANDAVIRFVNQLPLAKVFIGDYGLQTSSDGQKWTIAYESLNANKSFKYGGRDPVVSAYTFIDIRGMFPYSMVISGAEFEAHYMVDGLLKNDVVKSDLHSTDSHGYTEAIFGLTHLLKFSFGPRIKNPGKRVLYSFKTPTFYKKKSYPIFPKERINKDKIIDNWEDVLRLCASIKLGEVTASQIFKRLNSYSKNNPLYEALKAFGGIPKTLFLLRYADDVGMRKAIHCQLNKGEAGNKLDRALAIGRADYVQTIKEDQEIAETCKRLLKNVIVCWNFMYLSKRLSEAKTDVEYSLLLKKIKASSMLSWEHFVFHGEFDFSQNSLKDSQQIDLQKILDPDLIKE